MNKLLLSLFCLLVGVGSATAADKWTKASSIEEGSEYLILSSDVAYCTNSTTDNNKTVTYLTAIKATQDDPITIDSNGQITSIIPSGVGVFTFEEATPKDDGTKQYRVKISDLDGKLTGYYNTTAAKSMKVSDKVSDATLATVSFDTEGNVSISFGSSYGQIYYNTANPRFLNYTSSQTKIQLFKKNISKPGEISIWYQGEEMNLDEEFEVGKDSPLTFKAENAGFYHVDFDYTDLDGNSSKGNTTISCEDDGSALWYPVSGPGEYLVTVTAKVDKDATEYSEVSFMCNVSALKSPNFSWSVDSTVAYLDALPEFVVPVLQDPDGLLLKYADEAGDLYEFESTDEDVIEVTEHGLISVKGVGSADVNFYFYGNDEYSDEMLSCHIDVIASMPRITQLTATFDFTTNQYGVKPHSSSDPTGTPTYDSEGSIFNEHGIKLTTIGNTRFYDNGSAIDFRIGKGNFGFYLESPEDYSIVEIEILNGTSSDRANWSVTDMTVENSSATKTTTEGIWTGNSSKVRVYNSKDGVNNIKGLVVTIEGLEVSKPVFDQIKHDASRVSLMSTRGHLHAKITEYDEDRNVVYSNFKSPMMRAEGAAVWTNKVADENELHEIAVPSEEGHFITIQAKSVWNDFHSEEINESVSYTGEIMTGVDFTVSDSKNAEAVYYNMQGVRVANPTSGLYIVVKNGKSTKTIK